MLSKAELANAAAEAARHHADALRALDAGDADGVRAALLRANACVVSIRDGLDVAAVRERERRRTWEEAA